MMKKKKKKKENEDEDEDEEEEDDDNVKELVYEEFLEEGDSDIEDGYEYEFET